MNNNIKKFIIESIESNRDLFSLVNIILNKFSKSFIENLPKIKQNFVYQDKMVLLYISPITLYYDDIKSSDDFSTNLKNVMKKSVPLKIFLNPNSKNSSLGNYDRNSKSITINLKMTSTQMETYLDRDDKYIFEDLFRDAKSTLIHELKHWYDDIMTNGKVFADLKSKRYYDKKKQKLNKTEEEKNKLFGQYLKLNHEISARFAQIMQDLYFTRINSLQDMINYFQDNFVGWNILNNKQQRGLIRKASQLYWERIKHKIKTVNIYDKLQDYAAKKKAEGYIIDIGTYKGNIELYSLSGGNKMAVIKDLIRYSEIYRKYFTIYSDALEGIDDKSIEDLGFIKNKNGNVNFDIPEEEYFRTPRRLKK